MPPAAPATASRDAPAVRDARQPGGEEHERAHHHQQQSQQALEQRHVQPGQDVEAQRQAGQAAQDEGQQPRQVEAAPHRDRRDDLAGQAAEHRQGRRQLRLQRPGPQRHRREAEAESRQALHEAGQCGAESDDQDQFQGLSSRHLIAGIASSGVSRRWISPRSDPQ